VIGQEEVRDEYGDVIGTRPSYRVCACGCGASIEHRNAKTKYIDRSHSQRAYRRKVKAAAKAAGLPSNLSLETVQASSPMGVRSGDAPTPRKRRKTKPRPGVSIYLPTLDAALDLEAVAADLAEVSPQPGTLALRDALKTALDRRRA
jgi:hypothetical protein